MCGENGSVEVDASGGTGDLSAVLSPDGSNPNDLPAGMYTITITDAVNCSQSLDFEIMESLPDDIVITVTTMDACEGEEGMVDISFTGGCEPTCLVGDVPCEDITMLAAGTYTAVVTEGNITVEEDFTVNVFDFDISADGISAESGEGAFDGFINILVDAECENPDFSWVGPNGFTAQTMNIAGLESGPYTVTVSCDNGCSQSMTFNVPSLDDPCASFSSLIVTGVSCFGLSGDECDGAIAGTLTSNCMDPSFSVNGGPQTDDLDVTGLCSGDYNIQVFDGGVFAFDTTVTVSDGIQLTANPVATMTSQSLDDGTISLNISGGTAPYTVDWNQVGVEGENPTGLEPGVYSAFVTDANGCDIIIQDIRVRMPTGPEICFTALNIITPNADGANDSFHIECAASTNNRLQVFDRWGRLVYGATNYANNWQGIDNDGDLLDEGAYMWVLEVELDIADTRIYRGTLTILREL
jgi:gliding motility-associated-like protein